MFCSMTGLQINERNTDDFGGYKYDMSILKLEPIFGYQDIVKNF